MRRIVKLILLGAGVALAFRILSRQDLSLLYRQTSALGWAWGLAVAGSLVWNAIFVLGWRRLLPDRYAGGLSFVRLYLIRAAGESLNYLLPLGSLGGEPLKVRLLRGVGVPPAAGTASVMAARTFHALAQVGFGLFGLGLICHSREGMRVYRTPLVGAAMAVGAGILTFMYLQRSGAMAWFSWKARGRLGKLARSLFALGVALQGYYRYPGRTWAAAGLFFSGWLLTSLESILVLTGLQLPSPLYLGIAVGGVTSLLSIAAVAVPAGIGVIEGGLAGMFVLMGMDPVDALTLALVRRARELLWIVLGLAAMLYLRALNPEKRTSG